MIRINVVSPKVINDQQLLSEYHEILHIGAYFTWAVDNNQLNKGAIPKEYPADNGHVRFFTDKGQYVINRFEHIKAELTDRGVEAYVEYPNPWIEYPEWNLDYEPTQEAISINTARMYVYSTKQTKLTLRNKPITPVEYLKILRHGHGL